MVFARNFSIGTLDEKGKTPWEYYRPGRGAPPRAVPFGCLVWFLDPTRHGRKMDAKGSPGIMLCYGKNGTLSLLDAELYKTSNQVRIVCNKPPLSSRSR